MPLFVPCLPPWSSSRLLPKAYGKGCLCHERRYVWPTSCSSGPALSDVTGITSLVLSLGSDFSFPTWD